MGSAASLPATRTGRAGTLRRAVLLAWLAGFSAGCAGVTPRHETIWPERLPQGYTLILPGVFGNFSSESKLTRGLVEGNVPTAIEVYDWSYGPLAMPLNYTARGHIRREGQTAAEKIIRYQQQYPGRPVYLIGHSGGVYAAVCTLEALPDDRKVTRAFLFGAPIGPRYDLTAALAHTEQGLHNFYSPYDAPVLVGLTSIAGRMDNGWGPSAGALGFKTPKRLDPCDRWTYETRLVQHRYNDAMLTGGHRGGHFGWSKPDFTTRWLVPLMTQDATVGTKVVRLPVPEGGTALR